jgi:outer membrane protein assembly factor BamB
MVSAEKGMPERFDPGKRNLKTDEIDLPPAGGVRWVARLGGRTYGTPAVAGGKVFVGTNNDNPRDPRTTEDRGVLMCFDERTGRFLWQLSVPKLRHIVMADVYGTGLTGTPSIEGNRVYLVTNRGEAMGLDAGGMANGNDGPFTGEATLLAEKGGPPLAPGPREADILWTFDTVGRLGVSPHDSLTAAPLILGDLLYVTTGNGINGTHTAIANPRAPNLLVFNKQTGELLARDDFGVGDDIVHGQWSAPSLGEVNGKTLVFWAAGNGCLYASEPPDPKAVARPPVGLKYVWKFHGDPMAQTQDTVPVVHKVGSPTYKVTATPVFYKGRIYLPFTQEPFHGTKEGWLLCVDASGKGDVTRRALVWSYDKIGPTSSTVSIWDGLVFAAGFDGRLHCLDAETGRPYWVHEAGREIWGSTLAADGKVYVGNTKGDFWILAAAKDLKVLARIRMPDTLHCTPVAANGTLFVATKQYLFAVGR